LSLRPRPEVENLEICAHGGLNQAELKAMGLNPESVLDFSVCTNPFMPPLGLQKVVDTAAVSRYPDSKATEFRQCLSQRLEVPPNNILAGNGSTELVRLIALTYFSHGDSVLIIEPTFGEYEVACQIVGAGVVKQWGREEDNFTIRVEETVNLIRQHQLKGVFICNPNNPTGQYLARREVERVLDACGDGLLIVDEAYVAFVDGIWSSTDLIHRGNVIIVRSMTKDYALAGLRLGYAVASEEIINALRRVCPPWNVNTIAQKAGVIALDNIEHLEWCKGEIQRAKRFLVEELHRLGFTLVPSDAHFFLIKVNSASGFRNALLQQGIQVRDCTSFNLPGYVRIAPRTMPECQRLINTIQAMRGEE